MAADAETLRAAPRLSVADLKAAKNKEAAFVLLIEPFEAQQVLASRSQQNYMPQRLRERAKFSGMCVRDKRPPTSSSPTAMRETTASQRAGASSPWHSCVFAARAKFAPVTYDDHTGGLISDYEYQVTEEVLMPATEVRGLDARPSTPSTQVRTPAV